MALYVGSEIFWYDYKIPHIKNGIRKVDSAVLTRSLFFETLKSKRRLKLCRAVSLSLYEKMRMNNRQTDPFARFAALDEYDIYAGDGHYHAAAVHDVKKAGKKYPTQHFYSVDLRAHALRHLTLEAISK